MTKHHVEEPSPLDEVSDPIARKAAIEAVAATDRPTPKHPWIVRLGVIFGGLLLLAGTGGAIISGINSTNLAKQNETLKSEQACTTALLKNFELEQKARVTISADDRKIISTLVHSVSTAKTRDQLHEAFIKYDRDQKANDKRRESYPIPTVNPNVCFSVTGKGSIIPPSITPSVSPTK